MSVTWILKIYCNLVETGETKDCVVDTTEKTENLKDMVESGSLQMSWTKVNTSNSCGCNNACYNSCYNIG